MLFYAVFGTEYSAGNDFDQTPQYGFLYRIAVLRHFNFSEDTEYVFYDSHLNRMNCRNASVRFQRFPMTAIVQLDYSLHKNFLQCRASRENHF